MMELGPERDDDNKKVFDLLFAKYGFFDYTVYSYDIKGATSNNVIYPSLDPMIFEVKYLNTDIQGRVVSL